MNAKYHLFGADAAAAASVARFAGDPALKVVRDGIHLAWAASWASRRRPSPAARRSASIAATPQAIGAR